MFVKTVVSLRKIGKCNGYALIVNFSLNRLGSIYIQEREAKS